MTNSLGLFLSDPSVRSVVVKGKALGGDPNPNPNPRIGGMKEWG